MSKGTNEGTGDREDNKICEGAVGEMTKGMTESVREQGVKKIADEQENENKKTCYWRNERTN